MLLPDTASIGTSVRDCKKRSTASSDINLLLALIKLPASCTRLGTCPYTALSNVIVVL